MDLVYQVVQLKKDMAESVKNLVEFQQQKSQSSDASEIMSLKQTARRFSTAKHSPLIDNADTNAERTDELALNDLQNILSMTAVFNPPSDTIVGDNPLAPTQINRRRRSSLMSYDFFNSGGSSGELSTGNHVSTSPLDDQDEWGDVDVTTAAVEGDTSIVLQGYIRMRKPNSSKFLKQYLVLNKSHQLIYYNDKSDVTGHIATAKGIIHSSDVKSTLRSDVDSLAIDLDCKSGKYCLQAYTQVEADEWYTALCSGIIAVGDIASIYMESGLTDTEDVIDMSFSNPLNRPKRKQSIRRASIVEPKKNGANITTSSCNGIPKEKKGYLKKDNMWVWQQRWFELTNPGILSWYKQVSESGVGSDHGAKGQLSLHDVISVDQSAEDPCFFSIDVKGRTHKLQADSGGLAAEWCALLIEWIKYLPFAELGNEESPFASVPLSADNIELKAVQKDNIVSSLAPASGARKNGRRTSILVAQIEDNAICAPNKDIEEAQGWIKKKIETGAWERQWLRISKPGDMLWFTSDIEADQGLSKAVGSLPISSILSVDLLPRDKRNFEVNVKGWTHKFQCYSEEETQYWYSSILEWMEEETKKLLTAPSKHNDVRKSILQSQGIVVPSVLAPSSAIIQIEECDEEEDGDVQHDVNNDELNSKATLPRKSEKVNKLGEKSNTWQERWLELKEPGQLAFYAKQLDSAKGLDRAGGIIHIADVIAVEAHASRPGFFDVDVKGSTYEFEASSPGSAEDWCKSIMEWVTHHSIYNLIPGHKIFQATTVVSQHDSLISVETPVELRGMLKKEADIGRIWRKRWCEVTYPGYMRWYASESDVSTVDVSKAKGFIVLSEVLLMNMGSSPGRTVFDINVKGKSFEFQASSIEEAHKWFDITSSWVKFAIQNKNLFSEVKAQKDIFEIKTEANTVDSKGVALPEKSGHVIKKSDKTSKWQAQWLELKTPGLLVYFTQKSDSVRGVSRANGVLETCDMLHVCVRDDNPNFFDIYVKGRIHEFEADSASAANVWCAALLAWVCHHSEIGSVPGRLLFHHLAFPDRLLGQHYAAAEPPATNAGLLKKRGGFGGSIWHQRWCEITSGGELSWYAHERDRGQADLTLAEGYLALNDVIAIFMNLSPTTKVFDIDVRGKSHVFQASTPQEAQQWFRRIADWVAYERLMRNPSTGIFAVLDNEEIGVPDSPVVEVMKLIDTDEIVEKSDLPNNTLDVNKEVAMVHILADNSTSPPNVIPEFPSANIPTEGEQERVLLNLVDNDTVTERISPPSDFNIDSERLNESSYLSDFQEETTSSHVEPLSLLPEIAGPMMERNDKNEFITHWLEIKQPGILAVYNKENVEEGVSHDAIRVVPVSDLMSVEVNCRQPRFLDVHMRDGTLEFEAESLESALEWHDVIHTWIIYHLKSNTSPRRKQFYRSSFSDLIPMWKVSGDVVESVVTSKLLSTNANPIDIKGNLMMKPSPMESFIQRWFVISQPGTLRWFADEGEEESLGYTELHEVISVSINEGSSSIGLVATGRCYEIKTQSGDDAIKWFEAICTWIVFACNNKAAFISETPLAPAGNEKTGMVRKKSDSKVWNERWLELREPGNILFYAKQTDSGKGVHRANGVIAMSDVISVKVSKDEPNFFDVNVQGQLHEFEAESAESAQEWHAAMHLWIEKLNTAIANKPGRKVFQRSAVIKEGDETSKRIIAEPLKARGFLKKKKVGGHGVWQQRWFEVTSPGFLSWYASRKDAQTAAQNVNLAKGYISLNDVVSMNMDSLKGTLTFEIELEGRSYAFKGSTAEEAQAWFDKVYMWVDYARVNPELFDKPLGGNRVLSDANAAFLPEMMSLVKKKGGSKKKDDKWQERWLSLTKAGQLGYYGKKSDVVKGLSKAKGVIQMSDVLSAEVNDSKRCFFDVDVKGRTYEFEAESELVSQQWIDCILVWISHFCSKHDESVLSIDESTPPSSDYRIRKHGFLKKQGGLFGGKWQTRWFSLSDGIFAWFDNENDSLEGGASKAKGFIDVSDVLTVDFESNSTVNFEIFLKGRTMKFQADNNINASAWIKCILESARYVQPEVKPSPIHDKLETLDEVDSDKDDESEFSAELPVSVSVAEAHEHESEARLLIEKQLKEAEEVAKVLAESQRHEADEAAHLFAEKQNREAEEAAQVFADKQAKEEAERIIRVAKIAEEASRKLAERQRIEAEAAARVLAENQQREADEMVRRIEEKAVAEEASRILAEKQKREAEEAARLLAEKQKQEAEEAARVLAKQQADDEAARVLVEKERADEAAKQLAQQQRLEAEESARILAEKQAVEEERLQAEHRVAEEMARRIVEKRVSDEAARVHAAEMLKREAETAAAVFYDNLDDDLVNSDEETENTEIISTSESASYTGGNGLSRRENSYSVDIGNKEVVCDVVEDEIEPFGHVSDHMLNTHEDLDTTELSERGSNSPGRQTVSMMSSMSKIFDFSSNSNYDDVALDDIDEVNEEEVRRQRVLNNAVMVPKAWSSALGFETIGGIDEDEDNSLDGDSDSSGSYFSSDDESDADDDNRLYQDGGDGEEIKVYDHSRNHGGGSHENGRSTMKKRKSADHNERRKRRGSSVEDKLFMRTNSEVKKDEFLNKLKSNSVKDLNKEFWDNHKWYLTYVMCFVTLHVLYVTSFVLTEENE